MRKRAAGVSQTGCTIRTTKIVDIVSRYALLHAYGIGLDQFRELPEQSRMRGIDFAKWLLAYALDDEIDSAYLFFKALHCDKWAPNTDNYTHLSYLQYMYGFWRTLSGTCDEYIPIGAYAVAALITGQKVMFTPETKPMFYVSIPAKRFVFMEDFLEKNFSFQRWEPSRYRFEKPDGREDEVGNEPQCVDATEQ